MTLWGALGLGFGALSLVSGLLQGWAQEKEQDRIIDTKVNERFEQYKIEKEKGDEDH